MSSDWGGLTRRAWVRFILALTLSKLHYDMTIVGQTYCLTLCILFSTTCLKDIEKHGGLLKLPYDLYEQLPKKIQKFVEIM